MNDVTLEDIRGFAVGQPTKKPRFEQSLSTVYEFRNEYNIDLLPSIPEEHSKHEYIAYMQPIISNGKPIMFKSAKRGTIRLIELKLNPSRRRTLPVKLKSDSRTILETLHRVKQEWGR